jgi:hypothetical protein
MLLEYFTTLLFIGANLKRNKNDNASNKMFIPHLPEIHSMQVPAFPKSHESHIRVFSIFEESFIDVFRCGFQLFSEINNIYLISIIDLDL